MIAQAMGGVMALTGEKDGPPLRVEAGLGDTGSGLHAAIGILAAIVQRQVTGVGQRIEVAQMDVVINMTRIHFRDYYLGVDPIPRKGNRSPAACPSNTYRCKPFGPNDYVFLHTANIEMWKALTKVLGRPELGDDPRYQTREGRMAAQAELEAMVQSFCDERTKHEVMEVMGKAGVPCGAVLDSTEIMNNEHLRGRGMVVDIEHPTRGKMPMLGSPIRMSDSPVEIIPSPLLGEHNSEVYGKELGLGEDDLAALKRDKVI
jgi:formyl-CoA transferase